MTKLIHGLLVKSDGNGHLAKLEDAKAKLGGGYASTLLARYYKGASGNNDNIVIVITDDE